MASENKLQEYAFEQMNLQVGGRIQLITHRTLRPMQHFSTVIGWVRDEYMIVKIPMENNGPISVTEGDKLTVRVFSGVNVCSFSTVVQRVFLRPLMYAHVAFPSEIQGTSLRAAMRVKVEIPAKMSRDDGSHASVFLVNLSVSGALIESAQPLSREGETVQLDFTLLAPPDDRQVRINTSVLVRNATVAQSQKMDGRDVFSYGVQFTGLDPAHFTLLQNLTYEAMLADRQKIV
ncbi:c-di-GMP-binding flagellar brake protein YcgR, contains PilZNR and PilZ domains [Duganella sp. CF458]|uniref:flagellar brake protein n=1 Tax=Duganella sp. CF458 TaxID=1884368 RepID=UPI0008E071A5|nr:flagellar brake protein [Duganella sp. CF458]SFF57103.1 c-di-GMP-binding flagellar brake protein YcgR, contains PilZNR and PilZ domains [Duganella sp. CF458]